MDDTDRLPCSDVVCDRGGHYACHDLPPPVPRWLAPFIRAVREEGTTVRAGDPPDSVEVSEG